MANIKTKHEPSGLYLGPCRYEGGASIYLTEDAPEPIRICQTRIELAAYLNGWVDCNMANQDKQKCVCHNHGIGYDYCGHCGGKC
jgi:hypothetical protein